MITTSEFVHLSELLKEAAAAALVDDTYRQDPLTTLDHFTVRSAYDDAIGRANTLIEDLEREKTLLVRCRDEVPHFPATAGERPE